MHILMEVPEGDLLQESGLSSNPVRKYAPPFYMNPGRSFGLRVGRSPEIWYSETFIDFQC